MRSRLGFGVVEIPAILDILEGKEMTGMIMVELDSRSRNPIPPLPAALIAKEYLKEPGRRVPRVVRLRTLKEGKQR
jgi:inosose dehydratase